jgi:alpha-1,3-glucosyltransferase
MYSLLYLTTIPASFPRSFVGVLVDRLEMLYLAGFPLLHVALTVFPLMSRKRASTFSVDTSEHLNNTTTGRNIAFDETSTSMEFLPLMLTSVYCAVGLVWAFIRLGVVYMGGLTQDV